MPYGGMIAEVAELADALASGASSRKGVEVRVLSSAYLPPVEIDNNQFSSWVLLITSLAPLIIPSIY